MQWTPSERPAAQESTPALQTHRKNLRELRPGFHLHADEACEQQHLDAQSEVGPGLRLIFLLEGALDISYGDARVQLTSTGQAPCACLVSVAEAEQFTRRLRPGTYSRRVTVGLEHHWIEQLSAGVQDTSHTLEAFRTSHLATLQWQLSARSVALAEQIVRPPAMQPLLQNLYLECRSLELVSEAVNTLYLRTGNSSANLMAPIVRPRQYQRMREFHAFLDSGQADAMSMDELAKQFGINANSLQRQFRAVFGTTIFEHLRENRLLRARQALEDDGVSVSQAAMIAGYTSAANFATAYRRRFGASPKWARARV